MNCFNKLKFIKNSTIRLYSESNINNFAENFKKINNFKSKENISFLYPKSSLNTDQKPNIPISNDETFNGYIPIEELTFNYCRSSGPGGQNVNKVNSKVMVKIDLSNAKWISNNTKEKLKELHKNSLSNDGFWIIRSDKTRSQKLNIADCLDKIRCYITEAEKPPEMPSFETLEKIKNGIEKANSARLRKKRHQKMLRNMTSEY